MGDAYQGFRYVATTPLFRGFPWRRKTFACHRQAGSSATTRRTRPAYEAVLGAEAAQRTGLRIGDRFYEGEEMAEYPLTVVGILRADPSAPMTGRFSSRCRAFGR